MSSRGTTNLLTRTTAILAAGFFVTSLFLSWLAASQRGPSSIINPPAGNSQPAAPGSAPMGGLLDSLKKPAAPATPPVAPPAPPAGPQAPQSK